MNKELELKLKEEFPTLFRDLYGDERKTCMAWGLECGDGWYDLFHNLCKQIVELDPNAVAEQVKEKFGGLRFYIFTESPEVHKLIDLYENKSQETCEVCGIEGVLRNRRGWYKTLCEKHAIELKYLKGEVS